MLDTFIDNRITDSTKNVELLIRKLFFNIYLDSRLQFDPTLDFDMT